MAEQCAIYLDPYDKTNLEGTAMLIGRMPDIGDRTYRGVTCQRWFVRFLPDQAIVYRWLDYGDAEPYVFPIVDSHMFNFSLASLVRNPGSPTFDFPKIGEVVAQFYLGPYIAAYITSRPGRLIHLRGFYTVVAATGGAALTWLSAVSNDVGIASKVLAYSTTPGGPYVFFWNSTDSNILATGGAFTLVLSGTQPAGEQVTLANMVFTAEVEWGDFT